jgi:hypothetical protein
LKKEAITMKRLFTLLTAIGFALTLGVAFADEKPVMSIDRSGGLYNGITYFDVGAGCSVSEASDASGSAAGGMREESSAVIENGVTLFTPAAGGQCDWGLTEKGPNLENGVTYFGPHPEGM